MQPRIKTKERIFSLIALLVVPILFFLFVEAALKILDVGQDYDYFSEISVDGEDFYQENPSFAHQFYPAELNIGPLYNTFSAERERDHIRIYILGGSAAMGFPHRNHGLERHLQTLLQAALPEKRVEVINTAMTAVNSHVIYEVARSIPRNSGDFAVILLGNNEVVGPYGPATFGQNFLSNLTLIRTIQTLKRTRIWQVLYKTLNSISAKQAKEALKWEGMRMFTEQTIQQDDPRLARVYSHFEANLRDTIRVLNEKGLHVMLSTVPVNLRQQAPFASEHGLTLAEKDETQWKQLILESKASADASDWASAEATLRQALLISKDHAESHYQLAVTLEKQEKWLKAKHHYVLARDLDTLRFRADSGINTVINRVARGANTTHLTLIDAVQRFEMLSSPYQPGWNLFLEHVHFGFEGNYALARLIGEAIQARISSEAPPSWLTRQQAADQMGFPNYETLENLEMVDALAQKSPFTGQSNHKALLEFISNRKQAMTSELGTYRDLILKRRGVLDSERVDWRLLFEVAVLAESQGNKNTALMFYERAFNAYPHNRETQIKLATLLTQDKNWQTAIFYLERSLNYTRGNRTHVAETLGWLGTAYVQLGQLDKGQNLLKQVIHAYADQIDPALRAYANLVRFSVDRSDEEATQQHVAGTLNYANKLLKTQGAADYSERQLRFRVAQILALAGQQDLARQWYQPER